MEKKMVQYVLGFLFSEDKKNVVLIKKTKPEWQAGRLNGVGGKIEKEEYPGEAMIREFVEETGLQTQPHNWTWFASMLNDEFIVYCFVGYGDVEFVKTTTEEEVLVVEVERVKEHKTISNLSWLLPMALDSEKFEPVEIYYKPDDKYIEDGNR